MKLFHFRASRNFDYVLTPDDNSSIFSPAVAVLSGLIAHTAFIVPSIPGWAIQAIIGLLTGPLVFAINKWIGRVMDDRRERKLRLAEQQRVAELSRSAEE